MSDQPTAEQDLVAALGALVNPPKGGKVEAGAIRYRFMTLDALFDAVRPVFAAHRLAVFHLEENDPEQGTVSVVTRIMHASGTVWDSPPKVTTYTPRDNRTLGGASTFARRFGLAAFVGLVGDEDDDGQAAQNPRGNTPEVFNQTRPVTRARKTADDPGDAPYQTPLTPTPTPPAVRPVQAREVPDATNPRGSRLVTDDKVRRLWIELKKTEWSQEMIRDWVRQTLDLPSTEWHSKDLLGWQVDVLLDRLKPPALDPGPDRPRRGQ